MILQALYDYYQRKAADSQSGIAPEGWEWKPIPFIVVIDFKGKFLQLSDTRENEGKRKVPKQYLLPRGIGRAGPDSWKVTNLFWDHYGYVFGVPKDDEEKVRKWRKNSGVHLFNGLKSCHLQLRNCLLLRLF